MAGRARVTTILTGAILVLALIAACGPRPGRRPGPAPKRPARPLTVEPYEGALADEPRLQDALRRLPAVLADAEFQIRGALGIAIDRRDRLRVAVEEGAGRPGPFSLDHVWRERIRTWRVALHSEPLVRGDGDLDRAARAALAAAMIAEQEQLQGVDLPAWVRTGAPLYVSRLGDHLRRRWLLAGEERGEASDALVAHARWLYLERTFGPRCLARFVPALLEGLEESDALPEVFGRPLRAMSLESALFVAEWLSPSGSPTETPADHLDEAAIQDARRLRAEGRLEQAVVATERFLLLFPDSPLAGAARIDLARLGLDLGNPEQVLHDLAEVVDTETGPTGTEYRRLAFEAACRLARDGQAARILRRETELNGPSEEVATKLAELAAREGEALPVSARGEIEVALRTLSLPDRSPEQRTEARDAVLRVGRRALPLLEEMVLAEPDLAPEAVGLLESLGGERARAILERLAFEGTGDAAGHAVRALLRLGADPATLSDRLLGAKNAWPALRALRDATGRADAELLRLVPDLAVRLASPDPADRVTLADRLGDTGRESATTPLGILARGDENVLVRVAALRALGRLGDAGVAMLLTLLDDGEGASRMPALGVLLEVAPERATRRLPEIMAGAEPRLRAAILTIWSGRDAPGWADEAVARLGDSDPGVRRLAETVLVKGDAADAVPALLAAYEAPDIDADRATRAGRAIASRAGRDFGHVPGLDAAARKGVAKRMRDWWISTRGE